MNTFKFFSIVFLICAVHCASASEEGKKFTGTVKYAGRTYPISFNNAQEANEAFKTALKQSDADVSIMMGSKTLKEALDAGENIQNASNFIGFTRPKKN